MKAVPKININGLYLEDELVGDAFSGVVPFYSEKPDLGAALPPETNAAAEGEQAEEELQPTGYVVGVPVPPGLYQPHFNLEEWKTYQDTVTAAEKAYRAAYNEWAALPEEKRGEPPVYSAPEQPVLWGEGLTPEEIDVLHPPVVPTELERLQAENIRLKLAVAELAEVNVADKTKMQLALAELADLIVARSGGEGTNG
ncbi:hypothetical protein EHV15_06955 [Paenibacillus oralis]|uniref:Bacteriophage SP-beta YorD domain-containing protein n=1 Tax=Paenibacillus oralis TaxID=2490856 RepID=A0A3P3TZA6_9BACL|nr:hypothetical protein [Paenibacillus oralis]RRJ62709.1 hypothetical protein EHV15_06955 [Paenibacillus oralis]